MGAKNNVHEVAKGYKKIKEKETQFKKELRKIFKKEEEVWRINYPRDISPERLLKRNETSKAENNFKKTKNLRRLYIPYQSC